MIELLKYIAAVCLWGVLALVMLSLLSLGVWVVVSAIRAVMKGRK